VTSFADLSSPQVAAVLAGERIPVLLLPVGAIEPHGPHAPLGTDPLISQGMCERVAARLETDEQVRVLILPAIPYGVTRFAEGFPGGLHIGEETLHALIVDVCTAAIDQGLTHVVIVNNHFEPAHTATLRRVVDTVESLRGRKIGYLDLVRRRHAQRLTEEFKSGSCHAGRYETSLVLADRPELVDIDTMRELPPIEVDMPSAMREGQEGFAAMGMSQAYCGSPADASAEEGSTTFETLTDMLVEAIREAAV
jgi:creatinine amidohydrolase